jgi:hypothetical protein
MSNTLSLTLARPLATMAVALLLAACAGDPPAAPARQPVNRALAAALPRVDTDGMIAALQRVTARYHDLNVAKKEGFVLLHECESRPGEGPVGIVYVNIQRLMDGVINPDAPDALIYEPSGDRRPRLVGVEFAVPYALWTEQQPPKFLGATFQREDEFGVFALHAWVWRNNPDGLFAETNPNVSCDAS